MEKSKDQDRGKGAMEQDQEKHSGNTSMQEQLGHRDEDGAEGCRLQPGWMTSPN
jgi:hypothetical protein